MHHRSARRCLLLAFFVLASAATAIAAAPSLPPADQVLAKLRTVNDRFLLNWPDPAPDIVTDRARPSNIWTRATYFEGLMALHRIAPDPRYTDYAVRWSESHDWNLAYGSTTNRNADDQCCGQTYLDLYALDPRPERIAKIKTAIDNMVNTTKRDDWWWIDALQMAMPLFARLGVITGDPRYFTAMHELYSHTRSVQGGTGLYNPTEHLWWRDADFDPPYREPNGAHCYWARGNGWVLAALVRVLDVLPANAPQRAEYLRTFQDMAAALVPLQRADGFWNVSLKDPDNYGGRELTGTAFFAYGMAWGIRHGHLPRATYLPVVAKSWRALADLAVRPDGTLGYVQGTGKQPSDSQPVTYDCAPNFDDFGTGAFLLAGAEVYQLANIPAVDYIGIFKYERDVSANPFLLPGSFLGAEVRGTNLAAAFSSGAPQVQTPNGRSLPLLYDERDGEYRLTSFDPRNPQFVDSLYPNGTYSISLGNQRLQLVIGSVPAGPSIGYPPFYPVSVTASNTARPVIVDAGEFAPPAQVPVRVSLRISGVSPLSPSLEGMIESRQHPILTLPPFTLPASLHEIVAQAEVTYFSSLQPAVDLGRLGQASVEAGFRSSTSSDVRYVFGPRGTNEKLINVSSRGLATADDPLIAGFVISPGGPKMVLIRAVGPSPSKASASPAPSRIPPSASSTPTARARGKATIGRARPNISRSRPPAPPLSSRATPTPATPPWPRASPAPFRSPPVVATPPSSWCSRPATTPRKSRRPAPLPPAPPSSRSTNSPPRRPIRASPISPRVAPSPPPNRSPPASSSPAVPSACSSAPSAPPSPPPVSLPPRFSAIRPSPSSTPPAARSPKTTTGTTRPTPPPRPPSAPPSAPSPSRPAAKTPNWPSPSPPAPTRSPSPQPTAPAAPPSSKSTRPRLARNFNSPSTAYQPRLILG
jgi:unsaturated rhamnogalacturonyl hydrolase